MTGGVFISDNHLEPFWTVNDHDTITLVKQPCPKFTKCKSLIRKSPVCPETPTRDFLFPCGRI